MYAPTQPQQKTHKYHTHKSYENHVHMSQLHHHCKLQSVTTSGLFPPPTSTDTVLALKKLALCGGGIIYVSIASYTHTCIQMHAHEMMYNA